MIFAFYAVKSNPEKAQGQPQRSQRSQRNTEKQEGIRIQRFHCAVARHAGQCPGTINDNNQSIYFYLLVCRLFLFARLACIKGAEPSTAPVSSFDFAFLRVSHYYPGHFAVRQTARFFLCPIYLGWRHYIRRARACPICLDSIFPQ